MSTSYCAGRFWLVITALTLPLGILTLPSVARAQRAADAPGIQLAQKKKAPAKRKKKPSAADEGFGPMDVEPVDREASDTGAGVHREQEGVDRPYLFEATGLTSFSSLTTKAGDADATSSTEIEIGGELAFILGRIQIGPALNYSNESSKENVTTINPTTSVATTEEVSSTVSSLSLGPIFKFNFADLDKATLVPFAYVGANYVMAESKQGGSESTKYTGTAIRLGGGANFFLDSNVSFQPRLEYLSQSTKADTDGAKATTVSGIKVLLGLGTFL